jgi:hypothetical protein
LRRFEASRRLLTKLKPSQFAIDSAQAEVERIDAILVAPQFWRRLRMLLLRSGMPTAL